MTAKKTGNKLNFNHFFPFEFYKIKNAKQYLYEGRSGRGQAEDENVAAEPAAEQIRKGHADEESARDPLQHDKAGPGAAIKEPHEAKKKSGQQTVETEGLQIFPGGPAYRGVIREDAAQEHAVEESQLTQHNPAA